MLDLDKEIPEMAVVTYWFTILRISLIARTELVFYPRLTQLLLYLFEIVINAMSEYFLLIRVSLER